MAKFKDFYRVLGIPPRAHFRDIEGTYWEQAHELRRHPTRKAANRLKAINEAYEVLASPHRRAEYDRRYRSQVDERDEDRRPGMIQSVVNLLGRAFRPDEP